MTKLSLTMKVNPLLVDAGHAVSNSNEDALQFVLDMLTLSAMLMFNVSDDPKKDLHAWLDMALDYAEENQDA